MKVKEEREQTLNFKDYAFLLVCSLIGPYFIINTIAIIIASHMIIILSNALIRNS